MKNTIQVIAVIAGAMAILTIGVLFMAEVISQNINLY